MRGAYGDRKESRRRVSREIGINNELVKRQQVRSSIEARPEACRLRDERPSGHEVAARRTLERN